MNKPLVYQYAICISNVDYPASLALHKIYRVLPDLADQEAGEIRVIDESGEDYLYPAENFLLVSFPVEIAKTLQSSFAQ